MTQQITLPGSAASIPLPLTPVQGVTSANPLGPTVTAAGPTLTAITSSGSHATMLSFLPETRGNYAMGALTRIRATSLTPSVPNPTRVTAAAQIAGPARAFTFPAPPKTTHYQVGVSPAQLLYRGTTSVTVPVPASGFDAPHQQVTLAGFSVDITHIALVTRQHQSSSSGGPGRS